MSKKGNIVYFHRLLESANEDCLSGFVWDDHCVTLSDVDEAIKSGDKGNSIPYGDNHTHPFKEFESKEFHVSRVVYFIYHPEEICNIDVHYVHSELNTTGPLIEITDGYHRILDAKYLGLEKVHILYLGRTDVLRFLQCKRKTNPNNQKKYHV